MAVRWRVETRKSPSITIFAPSDINKALVILHTIITLQANPIQNFPLGGTWNVKTVTACRLYNFFLIIMQGSTFIV